MKKNTVYSMRTFRHRTKKVSKNKRWSTTIGDRDDHRRIDSGMAVGSDQQKVA